MRGPFASEASRIHQIKRADLVEKDLILHQTLLDLSKNKFFSQNFVFKGGTCLIKCYLGYFRFSEDIDFTWKHQGVFRNKGQKEIRRYLSPIIDKLGELFEDIAAKRGLDFKCRKSDKTYVELGGGNKICTFKIWYWSEVLGRRSFFKVQMTFVEKLCSAPQRVELRSLLDKTHEELDALYPEYSEYAERIPFDAYTVNEILSEKTRAILTREGLKTRDFLDAYQICRTYKIKLEDIQDCVVEKTRFMLTLYEKYRKSFTRKKGLILSKEAFTWGEEKELLLRDMDETEFTKFLSELQRLLTDVISELS